MFAWPTPVTYKAQRDKMQGEAGERGNCQNSKMRRVMLLRSMQKYTKELAMR